jgi:hypothetical protein
MKAIVSHLIYPTVIANLCSEIRADVPSPSGVVEALAWKSHAYLVLAEELRPTGRDCGAHHDAGTRARLFDIVLTSAASTEGDILEFGVAGGESLRVFADRCPERHVFGFDTFEGLPEDWWTRPKGSFAAAPPKIDRPNVKLVKGLFNESLPGFLKEWPGRAAIVHVDCDLYSSTRECLSNILPRCNLGTVVLFDEYYNYRDFAQHEWLAWRELRVAHRLAAQCIGYDGRRAGFQLTDMGELSSGR